MKGVFVPPGAFIPGKNITLAVGTIRGVESRGMLVSEFELQLSDDHEGIIDLPADAPLGEPYAKWAKLDDPVIEIKLTPTPDCTGVHGIARDLAAADMGNFKDPGTAGGGRVSVPGQGEARFWRDTRSAAALRAPRARRQERSVAGLAPAPPHRDRAPPHQRAGRHHQPDHLRPRRPLHVFDAAKVRGNLAVRRARG
jgi:phenylalanyl-tRNA synthetase beta chain